MTLTAEGRPMGAPRLGVNIDHVATLRQLRGTPYPDLLEAARLCEAAGAEQITVHLREDRRHIQDEDVRRLRAELDVPLNLEMSVADPIVRIACRVRPDWACLVPEKRREVTTEGGLDVVRGAPKLSRVVAKLARAGMRVSLFVEPSVKAVKKSAELGAHAVELHTGRYCGLAQKGGDRKAVARELGRIREAAEAARSLGLLAHAGHGLDYSNVRPLVDWQAADGSPLVAEYNIGHSIVCRAAIVGLERAVKEMVSAISAP